MKQKPLARWTALAAGVASLLAVGLATGCSRAVASGGDEIPVGEVRRGDLEIKVHSTGELNASHTERLTAPAVGGGALQITKLTIGRLPVKKGDVVIEFNPSEQRYKLEQSRSELLQAEQEIAKAKADAAVLAAQDKVALLKSRYDVRQAELDVQKREIVSAIDGAKNDAALKQAKRLLDELEKDVESHTASGQATIYLSQEKYNKAKLAMDQAQQNIDKMRVTAPIAGLVSVQKNMDASGGFFFTGMSLPDYRAGDQAQPGSEIAQVVDPSGLDLTASIAERDQSNIKAGQSVGVVFDALPGKQYHGTVKSIGGMSTHQFFDNSAAGTFSVSIQLSDADAQLRSGMTAQLLFLGDTRKDVISVPEQAIFLRDGKRIVYVQRGSGYEPHEVTLQGETETRAVVTGGGGALTAGTFVALVDPTVPRKPDATNSSATPVGGTP